MMRIFGGDSAMHLMPLACSGLIYYPSDSKAARHASIITTEIYTHVAIRQVKTVHANTHLRA